MIVTCPGCTANYRVRDEAVPPGGAKMRCPRCSTVFLALSPADMAAGDPGAGFDGQGPSPDPISGLFEVFDPSQSGAHSPLAPPQAVSPRPGSGAFPPSPRTPQTAASRHAASTSLEQLVGMMGGRGPAPSPAPPPNQPVLGSGDLFPPQRGAGRERSGAISAQGFGAGAGQDPFGGPAPPPQVAITHDDDDPFARLDIEGGPRGQGQGPQLSSFAEDLQAVQRGGGEVRSGQRVARAQPMQTRANPSSREGPTRESSTREKPTRERTNTQLREAPAGPSLGGYVGSWALVVVGALVFLSGGAFAAWTVGVIDLSTSLMPVLEEKLDVTPPRSSLGRDDPDKERLRILADRSERAGDLAATATAWRRVLAQGEEGSARQRLQATLQKLRHPGLLE